LGNVENVLREEIARVALRSVGEIRKEVTTEIARMNRKLDAIVREVGMLKQRVAAMKALPGDSPVVAPVTINDSDIDEGRLSPKLIRKMRVRFGLSQPQFARLCGVSLSAVGFWESGRVRPRPELRRKMIALRQMSRREIMAMLVELEKNPPPKAKPGRPRGS
jgi:DNA-binding XRE family transcriptional regulator